MSRMPFDPQLRWRSTEAREHFLYLEKKLCAEGEAMKSTAEALVRGAPEQLLPLMFSNLQRDFMKRTEALNRAMVECITHGCALVNVDADGHPTLVAIADRLRPAATDQDAN